jgi:hypothetical protein
LILAARQNVLIRRHNELAWLAWHTASLMREKRMTRLDKMQVKRKVVRKPKPKPRQSWEEQFAIMEAMSQRQQRK